MQNLNQESDNFLFLLEKVRSIARFLLHLSIEESELLFPDKIEIAISNKNQRMRYIYIDGNLVCIIRPNDGLMLLTYNGGKILKDIIRSPRMRVIVQNEVSQFISQGRNVFAKHIIDADEEIRPYSEVLVVNEADDLLAVGKAILNREEMLTFKTGIAVKVRHGYKE